MKSRTVFYKVAIDSDVMAILRDAGITEYSKIPRTQGVGAATGARTDDHIWPGYNSIVIMVVPDDTAPHVMAALQKFRDGPKGSRTGIFAFQSPVEAVLAPPPAR